MKTNEIQNFISQNLEMITKALISLVKPEQGDSGFIKPDRVDSILHIEDVAEIFRVGTPTVRRWLRETRQGKRDFPLPISSSTPGRRLCWNSSTIEEYRHREYRQ